MSKTYVDKDGREVELVFGQTVSFFPQGGGFQRSMPLEKFLEHFKEQVEETKLRPALFSIGGDEPFYKGYHAGRRWNGWAMPCFELEAVLQIQAHFAGSDLPIVCNSSEDVWETVCPDPNDVESWQVEYVLIGGITKRVFSIGAGSWCWEVKEISQ